MDGNQKTIVLNVLILFSSLFVITVFITVASFIYYNKRAIEKHAQEMLQAKAKETKLEIERLKTEERLLDNQLDNKLKENQ